MHQNTVLPKDCISVLTRRHILEMEKEEERMLRKRGGWSCVCVQPPNEPIICSGLMLRECMVAKSYFKLTMTFPHDCGCPTSSTPLGVVYVHSGLHCAFRHSPSSRTPQTTRCRRPLHAAGSLSRTPVVPTSQGVGKFQGCQHRHKPCTGEEKGKLRTAALEDCRTIIIW